MHVCVQLLSHCIKKCNKVSIVSERLLRATNIKDGGKQMYLILSNFLLGFIAWVHRIPWHSETHTALNTSPFLEMALSSSKIDETSHLLQSGWVPCFMCMCALWHYYASLLSEFTCRPIDSNIEFKGVLPTSAPPIWFIVSCLSYSLTKYELFETALNSGHSNCRKFW